MEFLINESQLRLILQEQDQSKMTDNMKELHSFTDNLVNDAKKQHDLNLKFLLTYGASVGGLITPLDNFIKSGDFNLTNEQELLILIGVASTFFLHNQKVLESILTKIKEEGLGDVFKEVLIKGISIKNSFFNFLKSANVILDSSLNPLSYAFLVPIMTDILSYSNKGGDLQTIAMTIAKRLVASGVVIVGQITLTEVIKKIIKKFS
jgi:hypothetical protein